MQNKREMILQVRVVPKSSRNLVRKEGGRLRVYLTKPAHEGLANAQLIGLLAEYLKVRKYQVKILKGLKSREKLVAVDVKPIPATK